MHQQQRTFRALMIIVAAGVVLTASTTAVASAGRPASVESPWDAPHLLYEGPGVQVDSAVTSTDGKTGVMYSVFGHRETSFHLSMKVAGSPWIVGGWDSRTAPRAVAWGDGQLSLIETKGAGQHWVDFQEYRVLDDGTLAHAEKLWVGARDAYPELQAAINTAGGVALAWSSSDDQLDHLTISHVYGTAGDLPTVPIVHPTQDGVPLMANPRAISLDDKGRVTDLTWGTLNGSSPVLWLERLVDSTWRSQRVGPLDGGVLAPEHVDQVGYATNTHGDIAISWQQQDPTTQTWSTMVRFAPAGKKLGPPTVLADQGCPTEDTTACAGLAMAADGTTTIAYPSDAGNDNLQVNVTHRLPDGTFTTPQPVSAPIWADTFHGVQVTGNPAGDSLVSFAGGDHQRAFSQFVRCPAATDCATPLMRRADPGPLDTWITTMSPTTKSTVVWASYDQTTISARTLLP